jgi:hypothetical protein
MNFLRLSSRFRELLLHRRKTLEMPRRSIHIPVSERRLRSAG